MNRLSSAVYYWWRWGFSAHVLWEYAGMWSSPDWENPLIDMLDNRRLLYPPDLSAQATLCPSMALQDKDSGEMRTAVPRLEMACSTKDH